MKSAFIMGRRQTKRSSNIAATHSNTEGDNNTRSSKLTRRHRRAKHQAASSGFHGNGATVPSDGGRNNDIAISKNHTSNNNRRNPLRFIRRQSGRLFSLRRRSSLDANKSSNKQEGAEISSPKGVHDLSSWEIEKRSQDDKKNVAANPSNPENSAVISSSSSSSSVTHHGSLGQRQVTVVTTKQAMMEPRVGAATRTTAPFATTDYEPVQVNENSLMPPLLRSVPKLVVLRQDDDEDTTTVADYSTDAISCSIMTMSTSGEVADAILEVNENDVDSIQFSSQNPAQGIPKSSEESPMVDQRQSIAVSSSSPHSSLIGLRVQVISKSDNGQSGVIKDVVTLRRIEVDYGGGKSGFKALTSLRFSIWQPCDYNKETKKVAFVEPRPSEERDIVGDCNASDGHQNIELDPSDIVATTSLVTLPRDKGKTSGTTTSQHKVLHGFGVRVLSKQGNGATGRISHVHRLNRVEVLLSNGSTIFKALRSLELLDEEGITYHYNRDTKEVTEGPHVIPNQNQVAGKRNFVRVPFQKSDTNELGAKVKVRAGAHVGKTGVVRKVMLKTVVVEFEDGSCAPRMRKTSIRYLARHDELVHEMKVEGYDWGGEKVGGLSIEKIVTNTLPPGQKTLLARIFGDRLRMRSCELKAKDNKDSIPATYRDGEKTYSFAAMRVNKKSSRGTFGPAATSIDVYDILVEGPTVESIDLEREMASLADFSSLSAFKIAARMDLMTSPCTSRCEITCHPSSTFTYLPSCDEKGGCGFISRTVFRLLVLGMTSP